MAALPYDIHNPPITADLARHTATVCANAFTVAAKTIGEWPINQRLTNGKRQPATAEVWAFALIQMGESDQMEVLGLMSRRFRDRVESLLPAAQEAMYEWQDAKRLKQSVRGSGLGRGHHRKLKPAAHGTEGV